MMEKAAGGWPCRIPLIGINIAFTFPYATRVFKMWLPFDQMASFLAICLREWSEAEKKKLYEQRRSCNTIYDIEILEAF